MLQSTVVRARFNVLLLSLCQALGSTSVTIVVTMSALVGYALAEQKALATLPITLTQLATMMFTVPASLIMKRWGRQKGLMLGSCIGMAGLGLGYKPPLWAALRYSAWPHS